jgi:predicted signal transduction protein with EAL and GGDEF domain
MSDYQSSSVSAKRFIESDRVEGTAVYDARGHHAGKIKRLIIEKVSGQVEFVIIAFQSFFGIGGDDHAVAWDQLHYDQDLEGYRTNLTEEQLRAAPDFPVRMGQGITDDPGFEAYYRIPPSGRAI